MKFPIRKRRCKTHFSEDAIQYAQHENGNLKTLLHFTSHVFPANEATNN